MVGVTGFEPATSASRTLRATKLRHTPLFATSEPLRESKYRSLNRGDYIATNVYLLAACNALMSASTFSA